MKKWLAKIIPAAVACIVAAAVIVIGYFYFDFVSNRIHDDSTTQLNETYSIIRRSVRVYVEQKWRILSDWTDNLSEETDFAKRKKEWNYEDFYFFDGSAAGDELTYVIADGTSGSLTVEGAGNTLFGESRYFMGRAKNHKGEPIVVFAIPVTGAEYKGTHYGAIGISFKNVNIAASLNASPYQGKAKCFVITPDGDTLFSTESGGDTYSNYLKYLGVGDKIMQTIADESERPTKEAKLLECTIDGVTYCILYQYFDDSTSHSASSNIGGYAFLNVVPQTTISSGFLDVRNTTIKVLIGLFALIGVTVISLLIYKIFLQSRKSARELKYREKMFDVLSNSVDDIFIMLDHSSRKVDYVSPNISRLLGIPHDSVKKNIRLIAGCAVDYQVIVSADELAAIPPDGSKRWECEYRHQITGESRWYRVTLYNMSLHNDRKYVVVMSDRTVERQMNKQLQEALEAAESANHAKSNFLSNMSHDIRTPMNAIVGFSVLLEKDADDPDKVREYTAKITSSSKHLLSLINDVLDMSKIESGKTTLNVEPFRLPELIEDVKTILLPQAKAKSQEFEVNVQGAPPEIIVGDKLRLNQILINLLSNAVKYTPKGGKVEFCVTELEPPSPQYVKLRFKVRDNGIGMSGEFLKDVFSPFSREVNSVTNKIQGTGLGMAITKNLVDLMGGIIDVESATDVGTTFTVELTFSLPESGEPQIDLHTKITRMLVADDDEDVCLGIKDMMRGTGVTVDYATDGDAAVKKAAECAADEKYDVILLDWKMPQKDGVQTAREIRERVGDKVPILVLTSYDWSEIEDEAKSAGINAFMPKPFFVSTFETVLSPFFKEKEKRAKKKSKPSVLSGKRILVAEDNELNAEVLGELLKIDGAECDFAADGKEAVEKFLGGGEYDLIFMDVQMPVMNGYEATKLIRSSDHPRAKNIPVIAMTANTFAEDVRDALAAGMDAHVAKPVNMDVVRETVAKILRHSDDDGHYFE